MAKLQPDIEPAILQHEPQFLSQTDADALLSWTTSDAVCWRRETFSIFGKTVDAPRRIAWFGDAGLNYRYTGLDHVAEGWPEPLQRVTRQLRERTARQFNFVILNRYDHGGHHMGWHRDDERAAAPVIASLSLGAVRRFRIQEHERAHTVPLGQGALLVFDARHRHMLAKTAQPAGVRVNLTFRHIEHGS